MAKDDRDILDILRFELEFIEQGGYGRSVRTPWKPTSIFQDSISCINFGDPNRSRPCDECLLMDFVPQNRRSENVPCHHIPLNEAGQTFDALEIRDDQQQLEESVRCWLRETIRRIEKERAERPPSNTPEAVKS